MKNISISKIAQVASFILVLSLAIAPVAFAQLPGDGGIRGGCGGTGLPCDTNISSFIMRIINIALVIAGLIAVLFLIIGGFRYITSAGNEETAESAKKIIVNAIIGIVIIILSFVIVRVITNALVNNNV